MATLDHYVYFTVTDAAGNVVSGGSRSQPEEITVDGHVKDVTKSLATATTWDAWISGAEESLTDFDFAWVESSQAVFVELVCDKGAEVGRVVFAKEIPAGIPWPIPTDDAMANYTVDFGTGTEDVIDTIRIRNNSGTTANVRLVLVT